MNDESRRGHVERVDSPPEHDVTISSYDRIGKVSACESGPTVANSLIWNEPSSFCVYV
ncbi:hypothetical protein PUNSTDRAFT_49271 [Punctularia strigosozonata HHB-11173 SS5]|uniref:uncharacterized protein n=1 Tax=Punctularia strigosozonata (strain HHB-11173) TaxID=741275 RepID=UPI0004417546|nr:uncharacterized protein PUNSTDRAFT_49271 [Punctularia strigosozonata HHB-11173 SS5]EIN14496.1 hypothetical protein PUNSTDRAFT_49271 [Punctularia strigosozonata HHB-11173 SS5]